MTDILPPAGWPNVRQLEINEFATGGANGNMNEQAKSLAARSELLKQYAALPYESKTGGYALNERVQLANGDIVKSTIENNTTNPNIDMTGWKFNDNTVESIADLISIQSPKDGQVVFVESYHVGLNRGGGDLVAKMKSWGDVDDILIFKSSKEGICWVRTNYATITPLMGGAVGEGSYDDTDGIQKCVNVARYVDMRYRDWNTTSKISIPSYRNFNLYGSNLTANNALESIFEFDVAGDNVRFNGGGGYIYGTADSFLKCTGSTNMPVNAGQYARQIRLDGLMIASPNIDKFLDFKDAVRQVFMDKVHAYTKNGISAIGKCVEVKGTKCIIYGATDDPSSFGIKLESPAGTPYYNEGFHFTDCTIDNFGTTFDVKDIYAMSVTGGHVGRLVGGKTAVFGQPTSTHCKDIKFTGVNIHGVIEFAPIGGVDYHAKFTGCVSESCEEINIHLKNNAASVTVSDHTFHTSSQGVAIVCENNNHNIKINDISCDSTFISGVQIKGQHGDNCSVRDISYAGTGNPIYYERPILVSGIPVYNSDTANYKQKLVNIEATTVGVGATISTVTDSFHKGETGEIIIDLNYVGANPETQVIAILVPAGMTIPNGAGWSSGAIVLNREADLLCLRVPYFITNTMVGVDIGIENNNGNSLLVGYHSYFGFKRDW